MTRRFDRIAPPPVTGFIRNWVAPLLLALAIVTPLRAALADWYHVPSGSMRPTILEGDRIFTFNAAFGIRVPMTRTWIARWDEPERGDIVTLASPRDGARLVKRVIGLPGDTIAMRDNRLIVNGVPVTYDVSAGHVTEALPGHPHEVNWTRGADAFRSFQPITVPEGHYFVMGDNRDQSLDSRYFGTVPANHIYGRASHVAISGDPDRGYLPRFDRWGQRMD